MHPNATTRSQLHLYRSLLRYHRRRDRPLSALTPLRTGTQIRDVSSVSSGVVATRIVSEDRLAAWEHLLNRTFPFLSRHRTPLGTTRLDTVFPCKQLAHGITQRQVVSVVEVKTLDRHPLPHTPDTTLSKDVCQVPPADNVAVFFRQQAPAVCDTTTVIVSESCLQVGRIHEEMLQMLDDSCSFKIRQMRGQLRAGQPHLRREWRETALAIP